LNKLHDRTGLDLPALRARVSDLGDSARAKFRFESLDIGDSDGTANAVKHLDEEFGPISHLFVVCGVPALLKDHPDAWKMVGLCDASSGICYVLTRDFG
jgi:hypothetical protein